MLIRFLYWLKIFTLFNKCDFNFLFKSSNIKFSYAYIYLYIYYFWCDNKITYFLWTTFIKLIYIFKTKNASTINCRQISFKSINFFFYLNLITIHLIHLYIKCKNHFSFNEFNFYINFFFLELILRFHITNLFIPL